MRSSNCKTWLILALTGGIIAPAHADKITLAADARLTGTVRSINEDGIVELSSELSPDPLLLKPGAVEKVEFSTPESSPKPPGTLIELANGDLLPATVENLDGDNLNIITENAGRLTIPRAAIQSIQLGVYKRKSIYSGPKNDNEWSKGIEESKQWKFSNGALIADGQAFATRTFNTPEQFILKFALKWKANPNIQIYFADPLLPKAEAVDRYYMQFNGAGLEIKRESSTGKRFQTVILLARTPDQFPNKKVAVEIRVDRKASRIHLLLDGEPEGAGVDPVAAAPTGNGASLINGGSSGSPQEIRDIEILELDNVRTRHRSEDRGDAKTDSLISRDEDRWSGRLISISKGAEGMVYSFKSDFQDRPLELTEADVSTIFFAQTDKVATPQNDHSFALRLNNEGSLQVSSCAFSPESVTAQHPLLGLLKISRAGIVAMEWLDSKAELKTEE
jgi:hypothetical protein